jgi:hypothetical protein
MKCRKDTIYGSSLEFFHKSKYSVVHAVKALCTPGQQPHTNIHSGTFYDLVPQVYPIPSLSRTGSFNKSSNCRNILMMLIHLTLF